MLIINIEENLKAAGLPPPHCEYGYPVEQLRRLLPPGQMIRLSQFMSGQTMMLCNGKRYDHEKEVYEKACNGVAHGAVIFSGDLYRFLVGLPVID